MKGKGQYEIPLTVQLRRTFHDSPYPNLAGMKTSYEYVATNRPDVWKHKPEEFADSSFVEELQERVY